MERIVFVCRANQDRSVLAEFLFRDYLRVRGIENVEVASAGFSPRFAKNRAPRWQVREFLAREGIELDGYRSRPLTRALAEGGTLLVAVTLGIARELRAAYPEARITTVRALAGRPEIPGVPDLIYGHPMELTVAALREAFPFLIDGAPGPRNDWILPNQSTWQEEANGRARAARRINRVGNGTSTLSIRN